MSDAPTQTLPRRVLMTTDAVGGVWSYALELATLLVDEGIEVVLAALGPPPSHDQRQSARAIDGVRLVERPGRLEWMQSPWHDVDAAGRWLLEVADEAQVELVHLNDFSHGALDWQRPVLVVGHSCVMSWFEAVLGEPPGAQWARYRERVAAGLRGADLVVAPTHAILERFAHHHGPFAAHRVIYNSRRAEDYPPRTKEAFVLSAGRLWDDGKNVAAVARAAPRLRWPVKVAGSSAHPETGSRPELEGVELLGRLEPRALAALMGRAAVYALPARYEPFGLSQLEAALAGCALVLGDIATLREVWGDAALYVAPDDTDALVEAVESLAGDARRCKRLAFAARGRALHYNTRTMARGYLQAYADLMAGRDGARFDAPAPAPTAPLDGGP